jgi:hypothetical protein
VRLTTTLCLALPLLTAACGAAAGPSISVVVEKSGTGLVAHVSGKHLPPCVRAVDAMVNGRRVVRRFAVTDRRFGGMAIPVAGHDLVTVGARCRSATTSNVYSWATGPIAAP